MRPMISPPTMRECRMKLAPSRSRKRRLGCFLCGLQRAVAADLADEEHDDRTDQERRRVQVQREVHRLRAEEVEVSRQHVRDQRQEREQAGAEHRRQPVRRDETELVGGFDLVAAHQVGDGRVLGGHPEQAHALDQEAGDQQPDQGLPGVDDEVRERIVRNSPNRTKSEMTMVMRRSNRSANAPASGPSTIAGSNFTTRTPPSA